MSFKLADQKYILELYLNIIKSIVRSAVWKFLRKVHVIDVISHGETFVALLLFANSRHLKKIFKKRYCVSVY